MADIPSSDKPKVERSGDRRSNDDAGYAGPERRKSDRRKTEPVTKR